MNDRFKFRYLLDNEICEVLAFDISDGIEHKCLFLQLKDGTRKIINNYDWSKFMQCTGLKDKDGLNLLFECDIINTEGIKIGNCYENEYLLKDTTNFVIKGMGTKEWRNSEQEAIKRGCYYAE